MGKNVTKTMRKENYRVTNFDADSQKGKGCCDPVPSQFLGGSGLPDEGLSLPGVNTLYLDTDTSILYSDLGGDFSVFGSVLGGLYSGDGDVPAGTQATLLGDLAFNRTVDDVVFSLSSDNLGGIVPTMRMYTTDPTYGNSALAVFDATNFPGVNAELMAICGVNNVADDEEAFWRAFYYSSTDLFRLAGTVTALTTTDGEMLLSVSSVDGNSDINIQTTVTGSGTGTITLNSNYLVANVPAYANTATAGADGTLPASALFRVTNGDGTSALHIKI